MHRADPRAEDVGNLAELEAAVLLGAREHRSNVTKALLDLVQQLAAGLGRLRRLVQIGAERVAQATDLGLHLLTRADNDNDVLGDQLGAVVRVCRVRGNLRVAEQNVAAQGAPQNALKGSDPIAIDDTRDARHVAAGALVGAEQRLVVRRHGRRH